MECLGAAFMGVQPEGATWSARDARASVALNVKFGGTYVAGGRRNGHVRQTGSHSFTLRIGVAEASRGWAAMLASVLQNDSAWTKSHPR